MEASKKSASSSAQKANPSQRKNEAQAQRRAPARVEDCKEELRNQMAVQGQAQRVQQAQAMPGSSRLAGDREKQAQLRAIIEEQKKASASESRQQASMLRAEPARNGGNAPQRDALVDQDAPAAKKQGEAGKRQSTISLVGANPAELDPAQVMQIVRSRRPDQIQQMSMREMQEERKYLQANKLLPASDSDEIFDLPSQQQQQQEAEEGESLEIECSFCNKRVKYEELDAHEQMCEQTLSNQHIDRMLQHNERAALQDFEDEFSEYMVRSNDRYQHLDDDFDAVDSEQQFRVASESAGGFFINGGVPVRAQPARSRPDQRSSNPSQGIPIVQMVQNRERRGGRDLPSFGDSESPRNLGIASQEEEVKVANSRSDIVPTGGLRQPMIRNIQREQYPRENSRITQSTPENIIGSFQHLQLGSIVSGQQPAGISIQPMTQQPIILQRTTHPSGVVTQPISNHSSFPANTSNTESLISQPQTQQMLEFPTHIRRPMVSMGLPGPHQGSSGQAEQSVARRAALPQQIATAQTGSNEEDADGGSAANTNEMLQSLGTFPPAPHGSQAPVGNRSLFDNRGGRLNYILSQSSSANPRDTRNESSSSSAFRHRVDQYAREMDELDPDESANLSFGEEHNGRQQEQRQEGAVGEPVALQPRPAEGSARQQIERFVDLMLDSASGHDGIEEVKAQREAADMRLNLNADDSMPAPNRASHSRRQRGGQRNQPSETEQERDSQTRNLFRFSSRRALTLLRQIQQYRNRPGRELDLLNLADPNLQLDLDSDGELPLDVNEIDSEDGEEHEYEDFLQLDEDVVNPVPKELIEMLPTSEFTEANKANFSEENKQCAICQCQYEVKEKFIILPCLHRFHLECIGQWFERKNTCPICKRRVNQDEEDHENEALGRETDAQSIIASFLRNHDDAHPLAVGPRVMIRNVDREESSEEDELAAYRDEPALVPHQPFVGLGQASARPVNLFGSRGNTNQRGSASTNQQMQYRGVRQILDEDDAESLHSGNVLGAPLSDQEHRAEQIRRFQRLRIEEENGGGNGLRLEDFTLQDDDVDADCFDFIHQEQRPLPQARAQPVNILGQRRQPNFEVVERSAFDSDDDDDDEYFSSAPIGMPQPAQSRNPASGQREGNAAGIALRPQLRQPQWYHRFDLNQEDSLPSSAQAQPQSQPQAPRPDQARQPNSHWLQSANRYDQNPT